MRFLVTNLGEIPGGSANSTYTWAGEHGAGCNLGVGSMDGGVKVCQPRGVSNFTKIGHDPHLEYSIHQLQVGSVEDRWSKFHQDWSSGTSSRTPLFHLQLGSVEDR